jgi:hypothetical protein
MALCTSPQLLDTRDYPDLASCHNCLTRLFGFLIRQLRNVLRMQLLAQVQAALALLATRVL